MMQETKHESTTMQWGGKGSRLASLRTAGFPVPRFVVLSMEELSALQRNENSISIQDLKAFCQSRSAAWQGLIGPGPYAVRSSAVSEDGAEQSFAGQFKSVLNVAPDDLPEAVLEVLQSARAGHVAAYLKAAGAETRVDMAVIIQEMIPATAAGVAFGINPLTGNRDEIVVNAVAGLGDKLVDGSVNSDEYILQSGRLQRQKLAGAVAVLSKAQLEKIAATLLQLDPSGDDPQDIEFAFAGETFYLLQARPVTAAGEETGERIAWDNSNIVESYPGLTLPLTFSFIEKMYEAVYRQFASVLGVPKKKIREGGAVYANMLGLLNGRVYYNLNSWYAALAQLPGYSLNAAFMEKMMGVKDKPDIDPPQIASQSKLSSWLEIVSAAGGMVKALWNARKETKRFKANFDAVYQRFARENFYTLSPFDIWNRYRTFEQLMVQEWRAPLANDLFAMIYFGSLQKFCAKHVPGAPDLHNRLLAGVGTVATTEPLRRIPQLAAAIVRQPELKKVAQECTAAELWEVLQEAGYKKLRRDIQAYLDDWGERCVAELKLETTTYQQEPVRLIAIIQDFIRQNRLQPPAEEDAEAVRRRAEAMLFAALKGKFRARLLARHLLRQARYFVANRENLRYYRTRGFGMVRKMLLAAGRGFTRSAALRDARDVFYLTLSEVESMVRQPKDMRGIVAARKEEYALFEQLPLPQRIYTKGAPRLPMILPAEISIVTEGLRELNGLGCSPGVARGVVRKVHHAAELSSVDGGILTTYATDPGYTMLFASAAGILTERGSLLSHAAIVSREMGIPCVVAVDGLMAQLQDGDTVLLDGSTGIVKIIQRT